MHYRKSLDDWADERLELFKFQNRDLLCKNCIPIPKEWEDIWDYDIKQKKRPNTGVREI